MKNKRNFLKSTLLAMFTLLTDATKTYNSYLVKKTQIRTEEDITKRANIIMTYIVHLNAKFDKIKQYIETVGCLEISSNLSEMNNISILRAKITKLMFDDDLSFISHLLYDEHRALMSLKINEAECNLYEIEKFKTYLEQSHEVIDNHISNILNNRLEQIRRPYRLLQDIQERLTQQRNLIKNYQYVKVKETNAINNQICILINEINTLSILLNKEIQTISPKKNFNEFKLISAHIFITEYKHMKSKTINNEIKYFEKKERERRVSTSISQRFINLLPNSFLEKFIALPSKVPFYEIREALQKESTQLTKKSMINNETKEYKEK